MGSTVECNALSRHGGIEYRDADQFKVAFVTGLSFVSAGEFTGQMRPIVENVPEPATLTLFGLGLVSLGFLRRRRAA